MNHMVFQELVIYFLIYSFLGYVCEVIYCSWEEKRLVNRGFLYGPYCPVYALGAIAMITFVNPFKDNYVLAILLCFFIPSAIEYLTGYVLEKIFNLRWWDYTNEKLNIKGLVCLKNSLMFMGLAIFVIYYLHPMIFGLINPLENSQKRIASTTIMIVISVDILFTLNSLLNLEERVRQLGHILDEFRELEKKYTWFKFDELFSSTVKLREYAKEKEDKYLLKITESFYKLTSYKNNNFRILKNYPVMHYSGNEVSFNLIKASVLKRFDKASVALYSTIDKASNKVTSTFDEASNKIHSTIEKLDIQTKEETFAKKITLYKLLWTFFLASFMGYILETTFLVLSSGTFQSRQGVLFGPFGPLYGLSAIIMLVIFRKLNARRDFIVFVPCAVLGGILEILSGLILKNGLSIQYVLHEGTTFTVWGLKTNLIYLFFYGVLGTLMIKDFYPIISTFIDRIQKKQLAFLSFFAILFMVNNLSATYIAMNRWVERTKGIDATNAVEAKIDEFYTNEYMDDIFPYIFVVE